MKRSAIALVALLIATMAPLAAAQATTYQEGPDYKFFELTYSAQGNTFTVRNDWNLYGGPNQIPYYIHEDLIDRGWEQAVRNAFWSMENEPDSAISFVYMGSSTILSEIQTTGGTCCPLPTDGHNVVSFGALPANSIGRGGYNGRFNIDITGAPNNTGSAELDITLSDTANLAVGAVAGAVDVESLVLHELGHALGLDHPTTNQATVMWETLPLNATKRSLHPADREALAIMYPATPVAPAPLNFVPVTPCAIFDTRSGDLVRGGATVKAQVTGPIPTSQINEACANAGVVPQTATGVMVNAVAIGPRRQGNLKISASGALADGGVVNFGPGVTNSNAIPVELSADGAVDVTVNGTANLSTAHVRLVILGYYTVPGAASLDFVPVTPCAVLDTRAGDPVEAGGVVTARITGAIPSTQIDETCANTGVVPSDATAAMVNVVAIGPPQPGNLKISAAGQVASGGIVNFERFATNSSAVPVDLSPDGAVDITVNANNPGPATHVRLVVLGYYTTPNTRSFDFVPVTPCAVFDTRSSSAVLGGQKVSAQITGSVPQGQIVEGCANDGVVPAGAKGIMVNVVAVGPSQGGNLKISASGDTANGGIVNFAAGTTNSNAVPVGLSPGGAVDVFVNGPVDQPTTHVRLVVLGYYQ